MTREHCDILLKCWLLGVSAVLAGSGVGGELL